MKHIYTIKPIYIMIIMDTTITISTITRDRIRKLGNMGDSYDTVINRIIDELHKVKVRDGKQ